jgi:hypothetical protein
MYPKNPNWALRLLKELKFSVKNSLLQPIGELLAGFLHFWLENK